MIYTTASYSSTSFLLAGARLSGCRRIWPVLIHVLRPVSGEYRPVSHHRHVSAFSTGDTQVLYGIRSLLVEHSRVLSGQCSGLLRYAVERFHPKRVFSEVYTMWGRLAFSGWRKRYSSLQALRWSLWPAITIPWFLSWGTGCQSSR